MTFVRREILELERRGYRVLRLAIRRPKSTLVDPLDQEEATRTVYILSQGVARLLVSVLMIISTRLLRFWQALRMTLTMSQRSERGLVRHLAYLVEACDIVRHTQAVEAFHLHVHFGTNAAAVARLAHCLGGPTYSMTVHGPGEFDAPIGFSLGDKVADSALTIAITDYCAAQLKRFVDYQHWPKIQVLRCTVDAEFTETRPISADSKTIVCVARLVPQKGLLVLLQALHCLVQEGIDVHLIIAGGGDVGGNLMNVIKDQIQLLELEQYVSLPGWVSGEQVRQFFSDSRALVLPSFAEGLPVVIMEAFAMKRPVVTTFVAGIPELVKDQINGWLVPTGQVEPLVNAIREVMTLPATQLDQMADEGYQRVMSEFRTEVVVPKLAHLFQTFCRIPTLDPLEPMELSTPETETMRVH